tara:strand:- start:1925 stop:2359 length:435 start_codon:yes stop_codon:yes gene_type:complete
MALVPKISITGDHKIDQILKELGKEAIKDADIKQVLRKVARPLINDIKSRTPVDKGTLRKSIGIIKGLKGKKGKPFIIVGPRYYSPYKGFHAHLIEVGSEMYSVGYPGTKMIFQAFQGWKSGGYSIMKDQLIGLLEKKLNKLKK